MGLAGALVRLEPDPFRGLPVVRRRLLVQVVVVPLAADRVVAVHQHARLTTDVAVPLLLPVGALGGPVLVDDRPLAGGAALVGARLPVRLVRIPGPLTPVGRGGPEQFVRHQFQRSAAVRDEFAEALAGAVARGSRQPEVGPGSVVEKAVQSLAERLRAQVRHLVAPLAEVVAEVAHRGEHERQFVGVVRLPVGEAVRLDQEHVVDVVERVEFGVQLVAEQPQRCSIAHARSKGFRRYSSPGRRRWRSDVGRSPRSGARRSRSFAGTDTCPF